MDEPARIACGPRADRPRTARASQGRAGLALEAREPTGGRRAMETGDFGAHCIEQCPRRRRRAFHRLGGAGFRRDTTTI
jgi:hypothetical protein